MSDPRFARLKTDPRFRRIRKSESKVTVDERFKGIFEQEKKKSKKSKGRVDKYGRPVSDDHEKDNLRRFYRLENEEQKTGADLARGEVLLESSDEEEEKPDSEDDEEIVTLGLHQSKPITVTEEDLEIDLDEDNFVDLDAEAEAYAKADAENDPQQSIIASTKRLAVVNLDWDHVKAVHLYKIFSSLVSSTAGTSKRDKKKGGSVVRGRVLNVRVYPSEFGRERLAREEKEGPPPEVFKLTKEIENEDEINEQNVYEVGEEDEFNGDALRKYQLERLRYYYAIAECDSADTAAHIYSELEGTELERSANVFDMSFVPDGMSFDQEFRDEATEELSAPFKPLEFTTDALRHSKVKLTWDEDDPERNKYTRRTLSRKEIEEDDFKAYIASSSSESEAEAPKVSSKKSAERDKLRALLLGGNKGELPEGWGKSDGKDFGNNDEDDLDMEITFTPGLSEAKGDGDETTLEKYQRKMKEKRKKRKEELKEKEKGDGSDKKSTKKKVEDDFFDNGSDDEAGEPEAAPPKKGKKVKPAAPPDDSNPKSAATPEELALLIASDNPNVSAKHFDMNAVLKAEKKGKRKVKGKKGKLAEEDAELQEDFAINVKDARFQALHEDHTFAIDPSNPHFKKTKGMTALLDERSKRQKKKYENPGSEEVLKLNTGDRRQQNLQNLVESVKRKSTVAEGQGLGKRRKL